MQKLYCCVDETDQDTKGDFFLVSVVVIEAERETLKALLEEIERTTSKGRLAGILGFTVNCKQIVRSI